MISVQIQSQASVARPRSSGSSRRRSSSSARILDGCSSWYVEPTVSCDVDNGARIAREESFGPVHMQPTFVEAPRGGYKAWGSAGRWGVEEYLETKQVFVNLDEKPIGWY